MLAVIRVLLHRPDYFNINLQGVEVLHCVTKFEENSCNDTSKFGHYKTIIGLVNSTTFASLEDNRFHYFSVRIVDKEGYYGAFSEPYEIPLTKPTSKSFCLPSPPHRSSWRVRSISFHWDIIVTLCLLVLLHSNFSVNLQQSLLLSKRISWDKN